MPTRRRAQSKFKTTEMKTTFLTAILALLTTFAEESAAAPAPLPGDHPVQLVVLGTKALKALGIHLPRHRHHLHQQQYQHHAQVEGNSGEEIPAVVVNLPALTNQPHHSHRRCRHNHRCRCPPGMKKDINGKCRKIWGP